MWYNKVLKKLFRKEIFMIEDYLKEEDGYSPRDAMEEASRCLLCLDAPCSRDLKI